MHRYEIPWNLGQVPADQRNANVAPKPKGWSGELQNSQLTSVPGQIRVNPLGTQRRRWIDQGLKMPDHYYCLL